MINNDDEEFDHLKAGGKEVICLYCNVVVIQYGDSAWFECPACGQETYHEEPLVEED